MAKSLNGWPVIKTWADPRLRAIPIPGTKRTVRLNKSVAPVFAAFLADWHAEMPKRLHLNTGPVDGWNYRKSRFSTNYSNHASGTAVDLRYDVLRPDGKPHMNQTEKKILNKILDRYKTSDGHRIFANGEWWRKPDGMHTELSQSWDRGALRNTTLKDVKEVQKLLGIDKDGNRSELKTGLWDNRVPAFKNVVKASKAPRLASLAAWRVAARLHDLGFWKGKSPRKYIQRYPVKAVNDFQEANGLPVGEYTEETHNKLFNL
jgi:hypothetical protein